MAKYAKQFKVRKCSFPVGEDKQRLLRHSCGPSESSGIISVSDRSTVVYTNRIKLCPIVKRACDVVGWSVRSFRTKFFRFKVTSNLSNSK